MADFIDREAVLTEISQYTRHYWPTVSYVESIIQKQPAADAVPVRHGRWEGTADGYADGELVYDMWACSECGFDADGAEEKPEWKYCPNCGAKMDLEGKIEQP